jgi:hypothetical protein
MLVEGRLEVRRLHEEERGQIYRGKGRFGSYELPCRGVMIIALIFCRRIGEVLRFTNISRDTKILTKNMC